ncbi:MAG TPA: hypothetical protein VF897_19060 [Roseiflexaceae bacterium]
MRLYQRLSTYWPGILAIGAAIGALALLWRVRDLPLELSTIWRVDGLSAFFIFATLAGVALALAGQPIRMSRPGWRCATAILTLVLAFATSLTLAIAIGFLLVALLTLAPWPGAARTSRSRLGAIGALLGRALLAAPGPLAAGCLLVGYGALALRGAPRYDDRTAGAAMDSFVFWFVLLAAVVAASPLLALATDDGRRTTDDLTLEQASGPVSGRVDATMSLCHPVAPSPHLMDLLRIAWLYPVARLYSLGPWNSGWSFAALLLGGGAACWCAISALVTPEERRRSGRIVGGYLALALAALGLGTSSGLAAACYGVLAYPILVIGTQVQQGDKETRRQGDNGPASLPASRSPHLPISPSVWLLSSAFPFTAPFVAAWMLTGAGVAGGVPLLSGAAWLIAALHGLALALWGAQAPTNTRRLIVAASASVLLGVGAPLVVRGLIAPAVDQLQGGLTPYGDVNVWPWVGLATSDAAHTQVTTLPSIAVALLMVVLCALVYTAARLCALRRADPPAAAEDESARAAGHPAGVGATLRALRAEVSWLGALLGPDREREGRPSDGE